MSLTSKWERLKYIHKCANNQHSHNHKKMIDHFLMIMIMSLVMISVALKIPVPTRSLEAYVYSYDYFQGRHFPKIWVGVCGALLETLTLFQTKICDFPYPISDLTQNLTPYFRPDPHRISLFHLRKASNSQR